MVVSRTASFVLTERDEVPLVEFEIRTAQRDAIVKRENVVDLQFGLGVSPRFAGHTMRLELQMRLFDLGPFRAARNAMPGGLEAPWS